MEVINFFFFYERWKLVRQLVTKKNINQSHLYIDIDLLYYEAL